MWIYIHFICEYSSGVETEWLREGTAKITANVSVRVRPFLDGMANEWLMFSSLLTQLLSARKELTEINPDTSVIGEKAARSKEYKQTPNRPKHNTFYAQ